MIILGERGKRESKSLQIQRGQRNILDAVSIDISAHRPSFIWPAFKGAIMNDL